MNIEGPIMKHNYCGAPGTQSLTRALHNANVVKSFQKSGVKIHEVYASKSTDKNQLFKQANGGDYTEIINTVLDPLNETFLSAVKSNREGKLKLAQENVLSGKTYNANDALKFGLIDKVGDFPSALKASLKLAKSKKDYKNGTESHEGCRTGRKF